MTFQSILFGIGQLGLEKEMPAFFHDLNIDQVVEAIVAGKEEYDLKPFFYTSLHHIEAVLYRQEVFHDLEREALCRHILSFSKNIREMRNSLEKMQKYAYKYQKDRLFLDAVLFYGEAVHTLADNLLQDDISSCGMKAFREYVARYVKSETFGGLLTEAQQILSDLSKVNYRVLIKNLRVQVLPYEEEKDYSREIALLFEKFRQGEVKNYEKEFPEFPEMNRVEAGILEGVASVYPELFHRLANFYETNTHFQDKALIDFDREIQFYMAYMDYMDKIQRSGLSFCYPEVSDINKEVLSEQGFDIALAYKLTMERVPVVTNDFYLKDPERMVIITGPNQGGKTTAARTFGQLHYLASLGCPVPGHKAKLLLFDKLFTHFEREEKDLHRSKLEDDLLRLHDILKEATPCSIIILNEILSSTALEDAVFLSKEIMQKIMALDTLCVWVTFIDELTALSDKTVSMVSTVQPGNTDVRTFKVIRKPADGLAYALSLAEKYKVTYNHLIERIKSSNHQAAQP